MSSTLFKLICSPLTSSDKPGSESESPIQIAYLNCFNRLKVCPYCTLKQCQPLDLLLTLTQMTRMKKASESSLFSEGQRGREKCKLEEMLESKCVP